ncbi:SubName: Full=Uncharacterized protein {ECO:0000313/EMBL:CCA70394.1} [Serendipita indica DSM 11827]|uniref:Uncharacterized protein n=1 Tax=Serendipita indica (strain DSM 11827) TaxID=1109443 RepID=G4TGF5_SERID|nr:SubName: Full=Uncharacterized protein {ECO:0000313/EMBL:CCA70394.1} [Serendipita indica DSM 11827]CCA70394.1 hypothetical protein PIIN_04333 [Serendipita indica DSM 11827]
MSGAAGADLLEQASRLERLVTPNLVKLRIRLSSTRDLSRLLDASGIPLAKLRDLTLYSYSFDQQLDKAGLRRLLLATSNLQELTFTRPSTAISVLTLLLEMDHLHQTAPGLCFGCGTDAALLGIGEAKRTAIVRFLEIAKEKYENGGSTLL